MDNGLLPPPSNLAPGQSSASRPQKNNLVKYGLVALFLVVLCLGIFLTYVSQHSQLTSVKKDLASTKSQLSAVTPNQSNNINQNEYQSVFLNSGQVYFGKITFMNKDYLKLSDIYYLQNGGSGIQAAQSNSSTPSNLSLVKLGCELHAPEDLMVINMNQVTFWENLQNKGSVVKAINNFNINNPNGQSCPTS